jgi:hypothetical protein
LPAFGAICPVGLPAKSLLGTGFSGSFGRGARREDRCGVRQGVGGVLAGVGMQRLERGERAALAAGTDHQGRRGAARLVMAWFPAGEVRVLAGKVPYL